MRRRRTSLPRDTRGAAYTEAVIVIPVFALLWAGVIYTGQSFHAKSVATQQARRCAWAYANGGCDQVPEGCEGVVGERTRQHADDDLDGIAGDDADGIRDGVSDMTTEGMGVADGLVSAIVGSHTDAIGGSAVSEPEVLGGDDRTVHSRYRVMCNERKKTLGGIVKRAFEDMVGGIF